MRLFWTILACVIFVILIGFALLNDQMVNVNFLIGSARWPMAAFLLVFFIVGGLIGLLVGMSSQYWHDRRKRHAADE